MARRAFGNTLLDRLIEDSRSMPVGRIDKESSWNAEPMVTWTKAVQSLDWIRDSVGLAVCRATLALPRGSRRRFNSPSTSFLGRLSAGNGHSHCCLTGRSDLHSPSHPRDDICLAQKSRASHRHRIRGRRITMRRRQSLSYHRQRAAHRRWSDRVLSDECARHVAMQRDTCRRFPSQIKSSADHGADHRMDT